MQALLQRATDVAHLWRRHTAVRALYALHHLRVPSLDPTKDPSATLCAGTVAPAPLRATLCTALVHGAGKLSHVHVVDVVHSLAEMGWRPPRELRVALLRQLEFKLDKCSPEHMARVRSSLCLLLTLARALGAGALLHSHLCARSNLAVLQSAVMRATSDV